MNNILNRGDNRVLGYVTGRLHNDLWHAFLDLAKYEVPGGPIIPRAETSIKIKFGMWKLAVSQAVADELFPYGMESLTFIDDHPEVKEYFDNEEVWVAAHP